jgi:DNA topoisomerase I
MIKKSRLTHSELVEAVKDHKKAAEAASLSYVCDTTEGIRRMKKGKGYTYLLNDKTVKDKSVLARIKKLAIPPSWRNVWICPQPDGHIQATGTDLNGRKQYRYHAEWHDLRSQTKFHHLYEFGKLLPKLRKRVKKDIAVKELTEEKVIAAAISLLDKTYIRVGNNDYEKLYGSYGLTTLKDNHVKIKSGVVHFSFTGKKGIDHAITLRSKKLAQIIKQCRDIPGKELFQYYNKDGNKKRIDSGMLNTYIREHSGGPFSAKDFRTWAGSLHALQCLKKSLLAVEDKNGDNKKTINDMLDSVSRKLGNSRNICKKYYVHPGLVSLFEENKLQPILENPQTNSGNGENGLTSEEKLLMTALKKCF